MSASRMALVFGANGFIGRWLVRELLLQGLAVVAALRSAGSHAHLASWLSDHGAGQPFDHVVVDFDDDSLGLDPVGPVLAGVTEVYNVAGSYRFGMTPDQARAANVGSSERIVVLASRLPSLGRLVHLSGYRVGGQDPADVPWPAERVRSEYSRLGAYEASKVESDAVVQATASRLGVPWTIVNPATVIGDSVTGESEQILGLAGTIRDLWNGDLAALPGAEDTFVPVVTVDYLAAFMALIPIAADTLGRSYWPLDDSTPALPVMLSMLADHLGVRTPRLRIPIRLLRALPSWITRAHPETLSFLSTERYPTSSADHLAERHGLHHSDVTASLTRWADHLVTHRFGAIPGSGPVRGFTRESGIRTLSVGDSGACTIILPGLPVNADTWSETAALVDGRAVDLPGLGASSGTPDDWHHWLDAVIGGRTGIHLVGHSVGSALALQYASEHSDAVARLWLVSPHFLQTRAALPQRLVPLTRLYLRRVSAARLAGILTGNGDRTEQLESSAADLRRASAPTAARLLRRASNPAQRADLARLLANYPGQMHLIVGSEDPLLMDRKNAAVTGRNGHPVPVHVIDGAGHHPQLTHPDAVARLIGVAPGRQ
ncbi:alpha/beta fold hydrolase [Arthrobacter sp. UYCu712]|uniref:alpha/beta fold hydrolase n=1 Tax=Arthrobacter sp. UYCu712 TaxID=3156340 RepID=UPI0033916401